MREIKFRGKRIDDGEWVVGRLIKGLEEKSVIVVDIVKGEAPWVFTETVGQYTGLKDKNGVEVYEGDIVAMSNVASGSVEYYQDECCYVSKPIKNCKLSHYRIDKFLCERYFEVIGNIYDNPELMEG